MGGTGVVSILAGCIEVTNVEATDPTSDPDDDNECDGGSQGVPGWLCGGEQISTARGLTDDTAEDVDTTILIDPPEDITIEVFIDTTVNTGLSKIPISGCLTVTSHFTAYSDDIGLDTAEIPWLGVLTTPVVECGLGWYTSQQNPITDMSQEEFLTNENIRVNIVGPMTNVLLLESIQSPDDVDPEDAKWTSGPDRTWGPGLLGNHWISTWEGGFEHDPVVVNLSKFTRDGDTVFAGTFVRGATVLGGDARRSPSGEEKQTMRFRFAQLLGALEAL